MYHPTYIYSEELETLNPSALDPTVDDINPAPPIIRNIPQKN